MTGSDDIWCDFCGEKIKTIAVKVGTRIAIICNHCASMCENERVKDDDK